MPQKQLSLISMDSLTLSDAPMQEASKAGSAHRSLWA